VESSKEGARSQTEYVGKSSSPPRVTVTRRHHPAEGKTFEVVRGGGRQLVIRLDDDSTMRIPRSWTDADGTGVVGATERVFTADAIRALGVLVALLRRGSEQDTPTSSPSEGTASRESSGGS
jgi:hypothetical protein